MIEMANQGRFARLCVEMDISKPLVRKVFAGDRVQKVKYEKAGTVCFHYVHVGHMNNSCDKISHKNIKTHVTDVNVSKADDIPVVGDSNMIRKYEVFGRCLLVQYTKGGKSFGKRSFIMEFTSKTRYNVFHTFKNMVDGSEEVLGNKKSRELPTHGSWVDNLFKN